MRVKLRIAILAAAETLELTDFIGVSIKADDTVDAAAEAHYTIENSDGETTDMRNIYNVGDILIDYMKITAINPTVVIYFEGKYF